MSEIEPPSPANANTWKEIVVPTAKGLERFFWNLVWFIVLICFLFSFNPFRKVEPKHENRIETSHQHQAVSQQPEDQ